MILLPSDNLSASLTSCSQSVELEQKDNESIVQQGQKSAWSHVSRALSLLALVEEAEKEFK